MSIYRVINYDSYKVHWANAAREDIAKALPPDSVTAETWYHWRTLCGKELVGHAVEDDAAISCQICVRAYARAEKVAADLKRRFGATT